MNFLSTLRALDAAATPGPWMTHFDPYNNPLQHRTLCRIPGQGLPPSGTFFVGHIIGLSPDGPSNADLLVFLRNHADAIAGVVEAAKLVEAYLIPCKQPCDCRVCGLRRALAALEVE